MEDPCLWHNGEYYEMIVEGAGGKYVGTPLNRAQLCGAHFKSFDGITWSSMDPVKAYGYLILMDDGSRLYGRQEKP